MLWVGPLKTKQTKFPPRISGLFSFPFFFFFVLYFQFFNLLVLGEAKEITFLFAPITPSLLDGDKETLYIFIQPLHIPPHQRRPFQQLRNQGHFNICPIYRQNRVTGSHAQKQAVSDLFQLGIGYMKWEILERKREKSFLIVQSH